jgi:hypothetical protein
MNTQPECRQTPIKLKIVSNDNKIKMQNNSYSTYVFKKKLWDQITVNYEIS